MLAPGAGVPAGTGTGRAAWGRGAWYTGQSGTELGTPPCLAVLTCLLQLGGVGSETAGFGFGLLNKQERNTSWLPNVQL